MTPSHVSIRDPRTRWGSAARTGRIALSWRLVLAPPEALETVVVHELAHLRVFGHGPDFWALVAESRVPDHLVWRRWLRTHSVELHATLAPSDSLPPDALRQDPSPRRRPALAATMRPPSDDFDRAVAGAERGAGPPG